MYLHIGGDTIIPTKELMMIIDLDTVQSSQVTKEFISLQKSEKRVIDIASGQPKSFVLTSKEGYLSPIASTTLKKRANFVNTLSREDERQ